jgi:hypothetical protein
MVADGIASAPVNASKATVLFIPDLPVTLFIAS